MLNWAPKSPEWGSAELELFPSRITEPPPTPLNTIIGKSENFPRPFPVDTGRCKTLKNLIPEDVLERNINSVYPILHENVLNLCAKFILHKRQNGTTIEKNVYKNMDLMQFIDRLLTKRAVTFMAKRDFYILMNGKKGSGGWESVGKPQEKPPLVLENCLSYEEMKLSVFLSVSSYTYFVNVGDRKNVAVYNPAREGIEDEGVIIGIIGPRLVKEHVMEYEELVITERQNVRENGFGAVKPPTIHHLLAQLYEEQCLEYKHVIEKCKNEKTRYQNLENGEILDNLVYYKRLLFSMDTLFIEANQRALEKGTTAYVHVVGIGLGVWKKSSSQNKTFMDSCGSRIKALGGHLHNVSDICFSYITHDSCLGYKNKDTIPIEGHPLKGIKIHISKREPHARLRGPDQGKLLVVSYAWDGNALPGNEFWNKKLAGSGDSAAASSTQIAEVHNPFINPRVCAGGLKVVAGGKLVGVRDYVANIRRGRKRSSSD